MSPISVPQVGSPEMKLFVPSIGSSTQTYSASGRSRPYSSPITPWSGKVCAISRLIAASAPRSASVTGSKTPPRDLSSAPIAVRKNGRITSPDTCASRSTKAAKSTAVMQNPHNCDQKSCPMRISAISTCGSLAPAKMGYIVIGHCYNELYWLLDASGGPEPDCNSPPNSVGGRPSDEEMSCNRGSQRRYCCGAA